MFIFSSVDDSLMLTKYVSQFPLVPILDHDADWKRLCLMHLIVVLVDLRLANTGCLLL